MAVCYYSEFIRLSSGRFCLFVFPVFLWPETDEIKKGLSKTGPLSTVRPCSAGAAGKYLKKNPVFPGG